MGFRFNGESLRAVRGDTKRIKGSCIIAAILALFLIGFFIYTEIEAANSVEIRATVEDMEARSHRRNGRSTQKAYYTLSYEYEGQSYTATIHNENVFENWRIGYKVKVNLNPKKPDRPFVKERKFVHLAGAAVFALAAWAQYSRLRRIKDNEITKEDRQEL